MEIPLDQRERVKELFDAALLLDPAARRLFLDQACSDASMRRVIEDLLLSYDDAGSFFSRSSFRISAPVTSLAEKAFACGEILAARFRVTRFIARGGVGEVYEAEDMELGQQVAIKTIRPDILEQPKVLARFKREVCLAKAVTHPNICRIFELFRHQSSPESEPIIFISMELLQGETLGDRLRRVEAMSTVEALPIIIQMASALSAAHSVGIVHRDFKPGNVVLVHSDDAESVRAVVTDFGMAFRSNDEFSLDLTPEGRVIGTPEWMSPEQIEGREVTIASDIYSLGLVIYRMITGVHPFQADTPLSCALKRLSERPLSPRNLVPGLSAGWEGVILKCLEHDHSRRFAKASEVAEALQGGTFVPLHRTFRRLPAFTIWTGLLLVFTLVVFIAVRNMIVPKPAAFHWQQQVIQSGGIGKTEIWRYDWRDIVWSRGEGWLCGSVVEQGGGGDIGTGILLHSTDRGASWAEVDNKSFNSGAGKFPWGSYRYSWHDVGPIHSLLAISRLVDGSKGTRLTDVWFAATSGVYVSPDNGKTWQRSTPRPDDPKEREIYAHFSDLLQIGDFNEVYVSGWQGIAHWAASSRHWELQLPTYNYGIGSLAVYASGSYLDFWAVANLPVEGQPHGLIYHLKQPENVWERLNANGAELEPGQGLSDIKMLDSKTGFAVGGNGVIVRGTKDAGGNWSWNGLSSPTREGLRSIEYDSYRRVLWIVGDNGTVLDSRDGGVHWNLSLLRDELGRLPNLRRVRATEEGVWILGNGSVYKLIEN